MRLSPAQSFLTPASCIESRRRVELGTVGMTLFDPACFIYALFYWLPDYSTSEYPEFCVTGENLTCLNRFSGWKLHFSRIFW